jgi:hypothetical protein
LDYGIWNDLLDCESREVNFRGLESETAEQDMA